MTAGETWRRDSLAMFAACAGGMAIGMAWDLRSISPLALAPMCGEGPGSARGLLFHVRLLPASHLLMLASAAAFTLAPVIHLDRKGAPGASATTGRRLVCCAAMMLGMVLAEALGPLATRWTGISWSVSMMIIAMTTGMMAGSIAHLVACDGLRRNQQRNKSNLSPFFSTHP